MRVDFFTRIKRPCEPRVVMDLTEFSRICVLTGAGISAESGVPTFRSGGKSTVWKGMPFEVISSAQMVKDDLEEVWEWFDYRRGVLSGCKPNAAHFALAELERRTPEFLIVTQNIDGLHERAGSKQIVELHGNINRARCLECATPVSLEFDEVPRKSTDCGECEGKIRPDVVLFGEMLPEGAFEKASSFAGGCDLCLVIGTSALVYPAASIPQIALDAGAFLVEINPEETPLTAFCDKAYRGPAGEILPGLVNVA